jgi:hypothetical protein
MEGKYVGGSYAKGTERETHDAYGHRETQRIKHNLQEIERLPHLLQVG